MSENFKFAFYNMMTVLTRLAVRKVHKFQEGVGEKIAMFVWMCSCFVTALVSALCHGWELTLVTLTSMPVSVVYTFIWFIKDSL